MDVAVGLRAMANLWAGDFLEEFGADFYRAGNEKLIVHEG